MTTQQPLLNCWKLEVEPSEYMREIDTFMGVRRGGGAKVGVRPTPPRLENR